MIELNYASFSIYPAIRALDFKKRRRNTSSKSDQNKNILAIPITPSGNRRLTDTRMNNRSMQMLVHRTQRPVAGTPFCGHSRDCVS